MESLFSPCTRLHDLLESQGRLVEFKGRPELLEELQLDVSIEALLSAKSAFTYDDLYAMLSNEDTVVWLTPHAAVMPADGRGDFSWKLRDGLCRFCFSADGKEIYVLARSPEHLLEICDIVLRLLAASMVRSLILLKRSARDSPLIHAPTLAYLMKRCRSLKALTLRDLGSLDENHCRVLGAYSRPDLQIEVIRCNLSNAGARTLVEVLKCNQGPTELHYCDVDYSVLADGLRGNSSLKSLSPFVSNSPRDDNRELQAIANALKENRGLVSLNLSGRRRFGLRVSDETWGAICDSLKTHPTLEVLNLSSTNNDAATARNIITSRIQALLDMMKMNISIHTIHLDSSYSEHELFRQAVIPFLKTNQLRARVRSIQRTLPILYRSKVLGRALLSARRDTNRFWMLLSGNPEVTFASRMTTTAAVANRSTPPADPAATSMTSATTAATSVMPALSETTTDRCPTAAPHAATSATTSSTTSPSDIFVPSITAATNTPSADQKRKARPEFYQGQTGSSIKYGIRECTY
jgi:hypothetical protein